MDILEKFDQFVKIARTKYFYTFNIEKSSTEFFSEKKNLELSEDFLSYLDTIIHN